MKQQMLNIFIFITLIQVNIFAMDVNVCEPIQDFLITEVNLPDYIYRPYQDPEKISQAVNFPTVYSFSKVRVVYEQGENLFEEIGTVACLQKKHLAEINKENYFYISHFFIDDIKKAQNRENLSTGLLVIGLTKINSNKVTMNLKTINQE